MAWGSAAGEEFGNCLLKDLLPVQDFALTPYFITKLSSSNRQF